MIRVETIWLACGVSDLRAGMGTLLARVVRGFEGGAQMNTAYVFANRGATRLKVLVADSAGLWLCTRRLAAEPVSRGPIVRVRWRSAQLSGSG